MSRVRMGKVQFKIMRVLWDRGRASAREITDRLNQDVPIRIAPCRRCCENSKPRGRSGMTRPNARLSFFPASAKKTCGRRDARSRRTCLRRIPCELMSYLLKNEGVSKKELEEIRRLIDEQARKPQRGKR